MDIMRLVRRQQGYEYQSGEMIHKELSEVLLLDNLRLFLMKRYAQTGITLLETKRVIAKLKVDNGLSFYMRMHRLTD